MDTDGTEVAQNSPLYYLVWVQFNCICKFVFYFIMRPVCRFPLVPVVVRRFFSVLLFLFFFLLCFACFTFFFRSLFIFC